MHFWGFEIRLMLLRWWYTHIQLKVFNFFPVAPWKVGQITSTFRVFSVVIFFVTLLCVLLTSDWAFVTVYFKFFVTEVQICVPWRYMLVGSIANCNFLVPRCRHKTKSTDQVRFFFDKAHARHKASNQEGQGKPLRSLTSHRRVNDLRGAPRPAWLRALCQAFCWVKKKKWTRL